MVRFRIDSVKEESFRFLLTDGAVVEGYPLLLVDDLDGSSFTLTLAVRKDESSRPLGKMRVQGDLETESPRVSYQVRVSSE